MKRTFYLIFFIGLYLYVTGCNGQANIPSGRKMKTYTYGQASRDGIGKFYMGREIAQVMGHLGASWLERPERDQEENTKQVLKNLELAADDWVADIGAGTGYYSFKIAPLVPQGKVFAVDIQEEMIALMKRKAADIKPGNLSFILNTPKRSKLPVGKLDVVFMVDVYHELSFPRAFIIDVYQALKPDGRFILLEYRMEDPRVPIKRLHKMSVDQAKKEMEAVGFVMDENKTNLPWQHFMVFKKIH